MNEQALGVLLLDPVMPLKLLTAKDEFRARLRYIVHFPKSLNQSRQIFPLIPQNVYHIRCLLQCKV
jgi:hypothetical protein